MSIALKILIAYCLDLVLGDPYRIPHPVQFIGRFISKLEKVLYGYKNKRLCGVVLCITVIAVTFMVTSLLGMIEIVEIYLLYTIFATRCLADEGNKVYSILEAEDMERAKKELSYLVSRDTGTMEERDIIRSTLETISENTVDGIIAPMFYMVVGALIFPNSPWGALAFGMTYKSINTLDSMVGYKNDRYIDFGRFSARLDDLVNLIPARVTGMILYPAASLFLRYDHRSALRVYFRDRKNHASPNSAHPEAAAAGALGIQFGGETSYFGRVYNKPTIGDRLRDFERDDIKKNINLMYGASLMAIIMAVTILYMNTI